jgi:hypothetical protein
MSIEDARKQAEFEAEARRLGIPVWQLAALRAVDDNLVRDLVADFRHGPSAPSSLTEAKPEPSPARVAVETPLAPPSGVAVCDRLVDVQDALDRRELERKLRK